MATIYISSTYEDLKDFREAVYSILRKMNDPVTGMEDYVATDRRSLDVCLDDVKSCDVYVGIFAWRYGYVPEKNNVDAKSITELEFRHAVSNNKACLIFLLDEKTPWSPFLMDEGEARTKLNALRAELKRDYLTGIFTNKESLAAQVSAAVYNWKKRTGRIAENILREPVSVTRPRELIYHSFLTYLSDDKQFASELTYQLELLGRKVYRSGAALFAKHEEQFRALETNLRQCHTAMMVLSTNAYKIMDEAPEQTFRNVQLLQHRTSHVIALCRDKYSLARAIELCRDKAALIRVLDSCRDEDITKRVDELLRNEIDSDHSAKGVFNLIFDISAWQPGFGPDHNSLILQVDRSISAGCPKNNTRAVGLPFVVIAMTDDEAAQLRQSPQLLKQPWAHIEFEKTGNKRYGPTREAWRPFVGNSATICTVVEELVNYLNNKCFPQLRECQIKVQYYSFDPLARNDKELRFIYREIAKTGCVILLDEFSLFHEHIQTAFRGSSLDNSEQAALVTISPFDLAYNKELETVFGRWLTDAFDRFARNYDPKWEFGIGDELRLKRWLRSSLPEALQELQEIKPDLVRVARFKDSVIGTEATEMTQYFTEKGAL